MAQSQDERRITENLSDPLKITHGEREESLQQQQPSAPSFEAKPTQIADDLNDQHEVHQPQKKSILQKVKDTALTLIHCGNDRIEDEGEHDNFRPDTEGEKKEKMQDLNSNFNSGPSQPSAGITSILQSAEVSSTARPYDDVQTDSHSDKYMAHQVHEIGTTDAPNSATHPVRSEFSPNLVPCNGRKEAPENELYGKDEPEKNDYGDSFTSAPRVPDRMMKPITDEPVVEIVASQQAAEDRRFDADDVVAGAPTVKDQNPSLSHVGSEEFGLTEPISDDKDGDTDVKRHGNVSDELQDLRAQEAERGTVSSDESIAGAPIVKDQDPIITHEASDEFGSSELNYANDKLGGEHQSVDQTSYKPDKLAEEDSYENSEKGINYGDEIYETDSKEKNEISSNLGNDNGEYEVAVQEEAEKRTERSSADDEEGVHDESRNSLRDTPYAAEGQNNDDDDRGGKTVEDEKIQATEKGERD